MNEIAAQYSAASKHDDKKTALHERVCVFAFANAFFNLVSLHGARENEAKWI